MALKIHLFPSTNSTVGQIKHPNWPLHLIWTLFFDHNSVIFGQFRLTFAWIIKRLLSIFNRYDSFDFWGLKPRLKSSPFLEDLSDQLLSCKSVFENARLWHPLPPFNKLIGKLIPINVIIKRYNQCDRVLDKHETAKFATPELMSCWLKLYLQTAEVLRIH